MSDTNAADVLRDEELASTHGDQMQIAIEERLKDVHTCCPGIIQSFDPATQTAVVQPAIKRIWVDDGPLDLPRLFDVLVSFPKGGDIVHTFPVAAGDECVLHFSERAIDNWWANGGSQEPSEYRMHDLSDAFAAVGVSSKPNVIKNFFMGGSELRTLDGTTVVRVEKGTVTAGNPANAVAAALATVQNLINQAVAGHVHVTACPAGAGTAAPSPTLASPPDVSAQNVKIS